MAGHRKGLTDERGKIVHRVLDFIENKKPKMFLLENVKGFTTLDNGNYVKQVLQFLKQIRDCRGQQAYCIFIKVTNIMDHGVPHYRNRWYCVGILKESLSSGRAFKFPEELIGPSINELLDNSIPSGCASSEGPNVMKNISNALEQLSSLGIDAMLITVTYYRC